MSKFRASKLFEVSNMGFFNNNKSKTLGELESDLERKKTEREIAEEENAIAELRARGQKWQDFSSNGKRSGLDIKRVFTWLKEH